MSERTIAIAQITLSIIFLLGYFWLLNQFVSGRARVAPEFKDFVSALLGVLTAGVGMILAFWFQRSRQAALSPELEQRIAEIERLAREAPP